MLVVRVVAGVSYHGVDVSPAVIDNSFRLCYFVLVSIHCGQRRPLAVSANTTVGAFGCFFYVKLVDTAALESDINSPRLAACFELNSHTYIYGLIVDDDRCRKCKRYQTRVRFFCPAISFPYFATY